MTTRRMFLKAGLATMAAADITEPARAEEPALTFVLVHGAWHNAQHWRPVAERLAKLGHRAVAVDLPAHGLNARFPASYVKGDSAAFKTEASPVSGVTLDDAARAVNAVIESLAPAKPVLVAHSVGGVVATRAAELAPDRIARLVYLTAFVPVGLGSPAAYGALPEARTGYGAGLFVADPAAIGAVRINPRGAPDYLEELRQAYYQDVPSQAFLPFALALTPDLPVSFWIGEPKATAARWGSLPRTFIRCADDRALALAVQDRMIADAEKLAPATRFRVETLKTSHSAFASAPDQVAGILAAT